MVFHWYYLYVNQILLIWQFAGLGCTAFQYNKPNESLNSKLVEFDEGRIIDIPYEAKVRIAKCWDGNTPTVSNILLMQCYTWLQFSAIRDIQRRKAKQMKYGRARVLQKINLHGYEKLLNKPLDDFRKFCIWKIFVPYFVNVKRLPRLEAFNRVKSWLDRCNSMYRDVREIY